MTTIFSSAVRACWTACSRADGEKNNRRKKKQIIEARYEIGSAASRVFIAFFNILISPDTAGACVRQTRSRPLGGAKSYAPAMRGMYADGSKEKR